MMRAMCVWCSVRSESGQRWICRDLLKLTIDRHKPNQDLYNFFYSEWMERCHEFFGAREAASMHAHFFEQIR
eukprot:6447814-Pyramimonas_sp.AAC.1